MRHLAERVNALARLPKERLGTKLPSLRCSAPAVDVPALKRRRLLAADMNVPAAPAPSNVQLARQLASGSARVRAVAGARVECVRWHADPCQRTAYTLGSLGTIKAVMATVCQACWM